VQLHWLTDESAALAQASTEGKPLLIDFGAKWCHACEDLEKKTFPDPAFQSEAQRFVLLHLDATDDDNEETKRLSDKYKVVGLPTIIMMDKDGTEYVRLNDFKPPAEFVAEMKKVPAAGAVAGK
jgi:thiol:disulfide interchange protein DsbD